MLQFLHIIPCLFLKAEIRLDFMYFYSFFFQDVRYNGFDRSDPSVDWEKMETQLKNSKLEYEGSAFLQFLGWPQD